MRPSSETSSRSSTSSENAAEVAVLSAVHFLQGPVEDVLGPTRFSSAQTLGNRRGILKARSDNLPNEQDVSRMEAAANDKIAKDAEVLEFRMERQEAEGRFGMGIYDLCPAPDGAELLKIVRIPEWGASCCSKAHVESTGSIGALRVDGLTLVDAGKAFELEFHVL